MKIKCLKCYDIIESLSQHDFKRCKCVSTSIDGGNVCTRIGGDLKNINIVHEDGEEVPCLRT